MHTQKHSIHQKETRRHFRILASSVSITFFMLMLLFMISPHAALSQETSPCKLSPIVVPTLPEKDENPYNFSIQGTGTAQEIDLESYRLEVTGAVDQPLTLKYDDLRCMPKIEARPTLICPGFFQDIATWAGVPLKHVLELAGVQEGATRIRLISADKYSSSVSLEEALTDNNFLAYEWEGEPIPILHGFPVRAIFPELLGNNWAKWLIKIEVY